MSNYNHAHYIGDALQALLNQTYHPTEILVIDDASTDNSREIIEQFAKRHPIIHAYRNDRNMGVLHNANRLLKLASCDYVYFASADDKILPGFFEKSMNLLAEYPQAGLCSTLSLIIDKESTNKSLFPTPIIARQECFLSPRESLRILRHHGSWFMGNTTIYHRQRLIDAGGFIPELRAFCDGFISQVIALKHGVCFIPEPLAAWRRMNTGYAATTSANLDTDLEITQHALHLMRTSYKDIFPLDYIKNFGNNWRLHRVLINIRLNQQQELEDLKKIVASSNPIVNFYYMLIRLISKLKFLISMVFFVLYYRQSWREISRQIEKIKFRMFERRYKYKEAHNAQESGPIQPS